MNSIKFIKQGDFLIIAQVKLEEQKKLAYKVFIFDLLNSLVVFCINVMCLYMIFIFPYETFLIFFVSSVDAIPNVAVLMISFSKTEYLNDTPLSLFWTILFSYHACKKNFSLSNWNIFLKLFFFFIAIYFVTYTMF